MTRADARLALIPAVGDFVPTGAPLFQVFGGSTPVDDRRLAGSVALWRERTLDRDPTFAFRILVDVAIKALSPGINDPTSAVMALDHLHALLRLAGRRRLDVGRYRDTDGQVRLTTEVPTWEDYVSLSVDEIRQYGAGSVQIARRLRAMLEDLRVVVPEERGPSFKRSSRSSRGASRGRSRTPRIAAARAPLTSRGWGRRPQGRGAAGRARSREPPTGGTGPRTPGRERSRDVPGRHRREEGGPADRNRRPVRGQAPQGHGRSIQRHGHHRRPLMA